MLNLYRRKLTMNTIKSLFIFLALTLSNSTLASGSKSNFNLVEIAEGNFVHLGIHVTTEDKQRDDIANVGFIIGDNCVAVIDTGGSIAIGKKLLAAIRSKTEKPICYVINTHIHFDHVLGNKVFEPENPTFVGHHGLAEAIEHNRDFFLEQFKPELGNNPDASSIIGPTKLVKDKEKLELGNRTLTLISYPTAHSHNDMLIIDNKTKTLWAGDLIFRERTPAVTGSLKGWIKVTEDLQKLDVGITIPGHGSIAESVEEAVQQQQEYLTMLLEETRKAVAEGLFVTDAIENIDKENRLNLLLHGHHHPGNVSKAFTELEWE